MPMVTKLVSVVTYLEEFPSINLDDLLVMWSCKVMWHIKNISAYRRPMGTKIVNASTHNVAWPFDQVTNLRPCNKLKKKKPYRSFTTWPLKLNDHLWPLNLARCWLEKRSSECKHSSRHQFRVRISSENELITCNQKMFFRKNISLVCKLIGLHNIAKTL